MKKVILTTAFFLLLKLNANSQNMWVGFPITVTQVNVNATDSYLLYSVFDTLINTTVADSTPVYSDQIYYNNVGPLLGYMVQWNDTVYHIFYNHNLHVFTKESNDPYPFYLDPNSIFGSPSINGNYFDDQLGDGGYGQVFLSTYADIVNNSFLRNEFDSDEDFGSYAGLDAGWWETYEAGSVIVSDPGYMDALTAQPGMSGGCSVTSDIGDLGYSITDGIMRTFAVDYWGDSTISYCINDGIGGVTLINPVMDGGKNGVVYYSDSLQMHLVCDDAIANSWNQISFDVPYIMYQSDVQFKDRVFAFAANKNANANVYFASYNFPAHAWVADSVLSNHVDSLTITNGTISWIDSAGTQFIRGYADTSGWGAFNTPLQIEFSLENMQSPTNGNLVYVRNYTIGSDQTTFDFGDGYVTTKKSESHLYRNPNGSYRATSSNFNYNICISVNGQSNCKPVSFVLGTQNLVHQNSIVNIRYDHTAGKFLLDNTMNKTLHVRILNLLGQVVKSFVSKESLIRFDLLAEASGVYLVQVMTTDGSFQQSIKIINY